MATGEDLGVETFITHSEQTDDPKVSVFFMSFLLKITFLCVQIVLARNVILKALKKGDPVMVRDVRNKKWDRWCTAKVTAVHKDRKWDILEVNYKIKSRSYTTISSRFGGILVPLDDDVATVLSFGYQSVHHLNELRIRQ